MPRMMDFESQNSRTRNSPVPVSCTLAIGRMECAYYVVGDAGPTAQVRCIPRENRNPDHHMLTIGGSEEGCSEKPWLGTL